MTFRFMGPFWELRTFVGGHSLTYAILLDNPIQPLVMPYLLMMPHRLMIPYHVIFKLPCEILVKFCDAPNAPTKHIDPVLQKFNDQSSIRFELRKVGKQSSFNQQGSRRAQVPQLRSDPKIWYEGSMSRSDVELQILAICRFF